MDGEIAPSREALREAMQLSSDLLRAIEMEELSLTSAALRASRLARLLNDFDHQKIFEYEAGGYPSTPDGIPAEAWRLAKKAQRTYAQKDSKTEQTKTYARVEAIEELEAQVAAAKLGLDAARDPNISYANPSQYVSTTGNFSERKTLHYQLKAATKLLGARRTFLYSYVAQRHLELRFSGIASDAFSRIREYVDTSVGATVPSALQKFTAIYDNLSSDNPENWSNAVHSCRRILQDLADALFPPCDTPRIVSSGKQTRTIKLGPDQYINRLSCFAEDRAGSERSEAIIGSHLSFLGERLDALFRAAQKGSHTLISDRDEADRYVVYTYMLVGDLLRLNAEGTGASGSAEEHVKE